MGAGTGFGAGSMLAEQMMLQRTALKNEMHGMQQRFLLEVQNNSKSTTEAAIRNMHVG